ncbi:hypothetical protein C367_05742 [Cryptococcus neoformans Ze90-1]|nr:hypothetical protein C367_05742 [Cryptococcus neoformans var. grubii Ze90-1]
MARLNVTVPSVEFSMSQRVTFTPQYAQPFTLQEATGLELDSLIAEVNRLINSLEHLYATQDQLLEFIESEEGRGDPEGEQAACEAYRENEELIPRQGERVALLCAAVVNKAGGEVVVGAVGVRAGEMLQRYTAGGGVREWWLGGGLHL